MLFLDNHLRQILKKLKGDLVLGSANKKEDIERTSQWSGDAVAHARMVVTYEKSANGYSAHFFKFRICKERNILDYVTPGANGKYSRAGNCHEHVGLALYYLFQHTALWTAVDVLTLDDCFDHVFLRVTGIDKKSYYFDSWSELIFTEQINDHLNEMSRIIIDGYVTLKNYSDSLEEKDRFESLISECTEQLTKGALITSTELTYTPQHSKQFIEQFDSYYNSLLDEHRTLSCRNNYSSIAL